MSLWHTLSMSCSVYLFFFNPFWFGLFSPQLTSVVTKPFVLEASYLRERCI